MLPLRRKSKPERSPRGANPPRKSGPPNSLFGEILDWMLAPLLFLWPISIIVTHNVADSIANQPYDLALADGVRALARLVEVEDEQIVVRFPAPPRALFRADQDDVVYFQVADVNGVTVSGDAEIPPMPTSSALDGEDVQLRDAMIHGEEVRIAWRFVRPDPAQADRFVLVQVAETRNKRTDLASRVVTGVLLPQFAIIPLAVVLVWVGLSRGIAPLNRLQSLIRRRRVPSDPRRPSAWSVPPHRRVPRRATMAARANWSGNPSGAAVPSVACPPPLTRFRTSVDRLRRFLT